MKLNKKGESISFIIAFTIFIVFILFFYLIISSPNIQTNVKPDKLNLIEKEFQDAISEQITIVRLKSSNSNCIEYTIPKGASNKAVVSQTSTPLKTEYTGDKLRIESYSGFMRIIHSNYISNSPTSLSGCTDLTGSIIITNNTEVMENKVREYFQIKYSAFKINNPKVALQFIFEDGEKLGDNPKNQKTNIYVDTKIVQYIDKDGNSKIGKIRVSTW